MWSVKVVGRLVNIISTSFERKMTRLSVTRVTCGSCVLSDWTGQAADFSATDVVSRGRFYI